MWDNHRTSRKPGAISIPSVFIIALLKYTFLLTQCLSLYTSAADVSIANGVLAPTKGAIITIGSTYTIKWIGVNGEDVNILLLSVDTETAAAGQVLSQVKNNSTYTWNIQSDQPEGYYQLVIWEGTVDAAVSDAFVLEPVQPTRPKNRGTTSFELSVSLSTETKKLHLASPYVSEGAILLSDVEETTTRTVSSTTFLAIEITTARTPEPTMATRSTTGPATTLVSSTFISGQPTESSTAGQEPDVVAHKESGYSQKTAKEIVIGSVLGTLGLLVLLALIGHWLRRRHRRKKALGDDHGFVTEPNIPGAGKWAFWWKPGVGMLQFKSRAEMKDGPLCRDPSVAEDAEYYPKTRIIN